MNYRLSLSSDRLKKTAFALVTLTSLVTGQVLSQPFIQDAQAKTYQYKKIGMPSCI